MKYFYQIVRFLVGGFFIFSGVVKAIDPMGTGFKMEEYFEVFSQALPFMSGVWEFFAGFALPIAIAMIVFEIKAPGQKIRPRSAWILNHNVPATK